MTDDEQLAERLYEHAKHGSHAYPALLYAAAERLYALSAEWALLGASLAQAEREAEAVAASEPFGYFRALPMGWEDCAETDEGAIPLYEHPQPDRVAALTAEVERLRKDAERYQQVRRGQKWSAIDGIGATLRGERLDDAIDAAIAAGKEAQS